MAAEVIPHVALIPLPAQGHAPPMLKLAELLSDANFYITFINTEAIHTRFLTNSSSICSRLSQKDRFRFRTIPDGVPSSKNTTNSSFFQIFFEILDSMKIRSTGPLKQILAPIGSSDPDGWPPVTCVVADGAFSLALDVVEELDIPLMNFRTSGACSVWAYQCIPELIKRGELPFPEEADLDEAIQGIPGMESILRRRDLPKLLRDAKSSKDSVIHFLLDISNNLTRGKALILNTFQALEGPVISHIRSVCPLTYAVGPLHLLQRSLNLLESDTQTDNNQVRPSISNKACLWKEDWTCMTWLDSQPDKSVVYVSFGSVTRLSRQELLEFWHGLVNSGHRFLWVLRAEMVKEDAEIGETIIPAEIEEGTREKVRLVEWAPQEDVLAHPATGCFLTHNGWNSTVESAAAGIPMVCWPFVADQHINSRFVGEAWKIGLDMKDTCDRSVVERMVRELMDGNENELRRSVNNMAKEALKSAQGGTSYKDLQKLILHIKSLSS